ncbi:MAG: hypothetical protein GXO07_06770, partial [Crenarchaeota archaeon]|nr:hypothetical protein [Thermoproteota archaeon]
MAVTRTAQETPRPSPTSIGAAPEKSKAWIEKLKAALERAGEEPRVRPDEIAEHLRLITGSENKPVVIWQKEERGSVTLAFERKSDLMELLENEDFLNALSNANTYVAVAIVDVEKLKVKKVEDEESGELVDAFVFDERLKAWVSKSEWKNGRKKKEGKRNEGEDAEEFNVLVLDLDYKGKFEEESLEKLAEFLTFLEEKGIDFNLAFSGGGFHLYVLLESPLKPEDWRRYQERFIELGKKFGLPADGTIKDPARVMRLIGTINLKYEEPKPTFWVKGGAAPVSVSTLGVTLPRSKNAERRSERRSPRPALLSVEEWAPKFLRFWKEGIRHTLALGIAGTLAKKRIHPAEAIKLVARIAEMAGDEELADRVRAVLDTYALEGWDGKELREVCKEVLGEGGPCALSGGRKNEIATLRTVVERNENSFKEILVDEFDEFKELVYEFTRAVAVVMVAGFGDTSFSLNFAEKTVKAIVGSKPVSETLLAGVPARVVKLGTGEVYVEFDTSALEKKSFGPADVGKLAELVNDELGVWARRSYSPKALVRNLILSILRERPPKVKVEERPGVWPGLYWWKDKFELIDVPEPSEEELRSAFELLMALRGFYPNEWRPIFWTVIKWGLVAPMFYALRKRYGRSVQALVLTGRSDAGKSSLAEIAVKMSGGEVGGADTVAAFGQLVSRGLAPVLIDEGEAFLERVKDDAKFMATVKRLFSDSVRGVGTPIGKVKTYEPRRTFVMAVNEEFSALPQIAKRMAAVEFPERAVAASPDFDRLKWKVGEGGLLPLSRWALNEFVEGELWKAFEEGDWKALADEIVRRLLVKVGREDLIDEASAWALKGRERHEDDLYDAVITKLKGVLMKEVSEAKRVYCTQACPPFFVLQNGTAHFRLNVDERTGEVTLIIFGTKQLLNDLGLQLTPKQLADLLGGEYHDVTRRKGLTGGGTRRSVLVVPVKKLPEDV